MENIELDVYINQPRVVDLIVPNPKIDLIINHPKIDLIINHPKMDLMTNDGITLNTYI